MQNIFRRMMTDRSDFTACNSLKKEHGFTSVELLIVMLAGLILLAAGGRLAEMVFDNAKYQKTISGLAALRANIQQILSYGTTSSSENQGQKDIVKSNLLPGEFVATADGATITHPLGGTVEIHLVAGGSIGGSSIEPYFTIALDGLSQEYCQKLAAYGYESRWYILAANSKVLLDKPKLGEGNAPDYSAIRSACVYKSNENRVIFASQ